MKDSPNLDFLRAVAVLAVFGGHLAWRIGFHSEFLLNLSHLGVVIFFVHTALVLMFSLERLSADGEGNVIKRFYVRRAFRIYPLATVCVLTVFAIETLQGRLPAERAVKILISNLLLIQNITQARSLPSPLWSLPFEVQMYLLLPLVFLAVRHLSPLRGAGIAAIGIAYILALALSRKVLLVQYFPCFLAGVVAYVTWRTVRARIAWPWWPSLILATAAVYSTWGTQKRSDWIAALTVGLAVPLFRQISWRWLAEAARIVAQYSYGIYLFHSPLSAVVFGQDWPSVLKWSLYLALTAAIPVAAYHFLEAPLIRAGARLADSRREKRNSTEVAISPEGDVSRAI